MITVEKLRDIQKRAKSRIVDRTKLGENIPLKPLQKTEILICGSKSCKSCGSHDTADKINEILERQNLSHIAKATKVGCFNLCAEGPIALLMPQNIFYTHIDPEDAERIVESHIKKGKILEDKLHQNADGSKAVTIDQVDFFERQKLVVLEDLKKMNLSNIEDYIALDGYSALGKALSQMKPTEIIETVKNSGLRGRGGAGFSTGTKWSFAASEKAGQKYVICNGDEGDPGAFMDRIILECNPHSIIESMTIGGRAIGASKGVIFMRAEYIAEVKILEKALADARKFGFLGKNIFGSGFDFDITIALSAGAFVCGEETALLASIEGKRGEPNTRPPYPTTSGLWGFPTVINNVETWANIPKIILRGPEWFFSMGTPSSKGTKVFAITGKIRRTGLVEVPIGTTLREMIFDVCGGIPHDKKFKAVQIGGPSGGCLPAKHLDTPVDYDSLGSLGSMMGSGGIIVVDEDTCIVDFAKFFLQFTCDESCGKCTPCRIGNKRLLEILTKISEGKSTQKDLEELENLANHVKNSSLCGLGQTAPNPILSSLRYFKDEYIEHVQNKRCPAKVCKDLISYVIKPNCIGCGICKINCPVACISGDRGKIHHIDDEQCIRCGLCLEKCPVKAIVKEDRYENKD